mgnify:CR=1 FL=1
MAQGYTLEEIKNMAGDELIEIEDDLPLIEPPPNTKGYTFEEMEAMSLPKVREQKGGLMERSRAVAGPRQDFSVAEIGGKLLEAGKVVPLATVGGATQAFFGLPGDIESIGRGIVESSTGGVEGFKQGLSEDTFLPTTVDVAKFTNSIVDFSDSPYQTIGWYTAPAGQYKSIKAMSKYGANKINAKKIAAREADEAADELDFIVEKAIEQKIPAPQVKQFVAQQKGVPVEDIDDIYKIAGRKFEAQKSPEAIQVSQQAREIANAKPQGMLSKVFEPIQSRLEKISPTLAKALSRLEFNIVYDLKKYGDKVSPFLSSLSKLPKATYTQVWKNLNEGDFTQVNKLLADNPAMQKQFVSLQGALNNVYGELVDAGYTNMNRVIDYFPRMVKDIEGLYKKLGITAKSDIEKSLDDLVKTRKKKDPTYTLEDIDQVEKTQVINKYLSGKTRPRNGQGQPGFTKARKLNEIPEELLQYYHKPEDALAYYLNSAVGKINKRKFFGQSGVVEGGNRLDVSKSVGRLFEDAKLDPKMEGEVRTLLDARMNMGEVSPHKAVRMAKNLIYLGTIGNPMSAITQIGDLGASAFVTGNKNAIAQLFDTNMIKLDDIGIENIIAEISTTEGTSKLLNSVLKRTGFSKMDRVGKEQFINASFRKARKMSESSKGRAKLKEEWGGVFGDEFDSFITDLQQGNKSPNVLYYTFHELSEVQPISLSQMPLAYLQNPNLRIAYALKSFTIKQIDLLKKKTIDLWRKGEKKQAVKNAVAYSLIYGGMNTGTDEVKKAIMGRDNIKLSEVPEAAGLNVLKMFGASQYALDIAGQGRTGAALSSVVGIPTDVLFAPVDDLIRTINPNQESKYKTLQYLPVFGPFIRNYGFGGAERYNEKLYKERYGL